MCAYKDSDKNSEIKPVRTLKMSKEHCVRMVLKVEDRPSSTKLSK